MIDRLAKAETYDKLSNDFIQEIGTSIAAPPII